MAKILIELDLPVSETRAIELHHAEIALRTAAQEMRSHGGTKHGRHDITVPGNRPGPAGEAWFLALRTKLGAVKMMFRVIIETPARERPATRADDVTERARIQEVLLSIVSAVSNSGILTGEARGQRGGRGEFTYEVDHV